MSFHQTCTEATANILVAALAANQLALGGSTEERVQKLAEAFKTIYEAVKEAGSE